MSTAIGVSLPRLATAVGKAISEYAVLGKTPGFTADFIRNKYPGHSSLSSAITHARAGNATMTDGYGPELVTNGGFDSDSDWTKESGWTISDGVAVASSATNGASIYQNAGLVVGKTYEITYQVKDYTSGSVIARCGNAFGTARASNGFFTETVTCTTTSNIVIRSNAAGTTLAVDNVSVREMPVIKWAPHNLLTYSEDPSSSLTSTNDASWTTSNTLTATAQSGNQTPYARVLQTFTQKRDVCFCSRNNKHYRSIPYPTNSNF